MATRYYCLIAQKETKEREKMKCLLISCEITPEEYVIQLQENHCMEYQLVIYSFWSEHLEEQVQEIGKERKTGYGKNWYELTDTDISSVISAHLMNGKVILDLTSIADVTQHTLNMMSIGPERVHVVPDIKRSNLVVRYHDQSLVAPSEPVAEKSDNTEEMFIKTQPPTIVREKKKPKEWDFKVNNRTIRRSDYVDFIREKCNKEGKIHTVKLNDSFIEYLTEVKKWKTKDFSHPDDREELFKGFPKLGYEIVDSGKRYYVQGLRLKKSSK